MTSASQLEDSFLAELAVAKGIGRPLDFIPTFATPDPFLHEITAALTSAPRIKDPAANLFTETLLNAACARILSNYAEVRYPLSGPPRLTDDQLRAAIDYILSSMRIGGARDSEALAGREPNIGKRRYTERQKDDR